MRVIQFTDDIATAKKGEQRSVSSRLASRLVANKKAKYVDEKMSKEDIKKLTELTNIANRKAKENLDSGEIVSLAVSEIIKEKSEELLVEAKAEIKNELLKDNEFVNSVRAEIKAELKLKEGK